MKLSKEKKRDFGFEHIDNYGSTIAGKEIDGRLCTINVSYKAFSLDAMMVMSLWNESCETIEDLYRLAFKVRLRKKGTDGKVWWSELVNCTGTDANNKLLDSLEDIKEVNEQYYNFIMEVIHMFEIKFLGYAAERVNPKMEDYEKENIRNIIKMIGDPDITHRTIHE